jgi:hypothetical protein
LAAGTAGLTIGVSGSGQETRKIATGTIAACAAGQAAEKLIKLALAHGFFLCESAHGSDEVGGQLLTAGSILDRISQMHRDVKCVNALTIHRFATPGYGAGAATTDAANEARRMDVSNFMMEIYDCGSGNDWPAVIREGM